MTVADNIATVRRFYAAGPAEDVFETMPAAMQPLDRWEIDLVDVMANDDLVVTTVRIRGERFGRTVEMAGAHAFGIDARGRIAEAWGFAADQAALDAVLDPA